MMMMYFLILSLLILPGSQAQQSNKVAGPRCFSCASSALKSQWQVTGFPKIPNITADGEKAFLFQDANCGEKPEYKDSTFVTPVSSCPGGICIEMLVVADGIYSVLRGCLHDFFDYPPSSGEEGCTWGQSTQSALIATSTKGELVHNVRVGVNLCPAKEGSQCNAMLSPSIEFAQGKQHVDITSGTVDAWPFTCRKSNIKWAFFGGTGKETSGMVREYGAIGRCLVLFGNTAKSPWEFFNVVECLMCTRYDWEGDCHWNIREYCTGAWCTKTIGYINGRWLEQRGCAPFNPLNSQICTKVEKSLAISALSGQDVQIQSSTEQCFCSQNRCNGAETIWDNKWTSLFAILIVFVMIKSHK